MPSHSTLRIVLLAYDDMNLLDLSGPLQALATASKRHRGGGSPLYEIIVASADGGLITTSAGLAVMTVSIATLDDLAIDTLIAPGGCKGQEFYAPPALVAWIAQQGHRSQQRLRRRTEFAARVPAPAGRQPRTVPQQVFRPRHRTGEDQSLNRIGASAKAPPWYVTELFGSGYTPLSGNLPSNCCELSLGR